MFLGLKYSFIHTLKGLKYSFIHTHNALWRNEVS